MAQSGTFYPAASGDDGQWYPTTFSSTDNSLTWGTASLSSVFVRFPSITIPQGATITTAFVQFTGSGNSGGFDIDIYGNDIDDAVAPTSFATAENLDETTATVNWVETETWNSGVEYDSPSIVSIIQEIVDRPGYTENNAIQLLFKSNSTFGYGTPSYDSGADYAELYVEWSGDENIQTTCSSLILSTYPPNIKADITFDTTCATLAISPHNAIILTGFVIQPDSVPFTITTHDAQISYNISILSDCVSLTIAPNTASVFFGILVLTESVGLAITTHQAIVYVTENPINEHLAIYETVRVQRILPIAETLTLSESVTSDLGLQIREYLQASEALSSLWAGTETIEDMLGVWGSVLICQVFNETAAEELTVEDTTSFVHRMISTVAEALEITEVVTPAMTFNPAIVEALGIVAAVTAIRTLYFSNEEELEVGEVLGWQWQDTVAESLEATDAPSLAFRAILALTENLELTETVLQTLMVNEALSDILEIASSLTLQARMNVTIEDGLTIGLNVLLDGEVYECWVLTSNQFNPSVYSGFDFNSYATFGSSAYGCKDDGIYELTGDTDQGAAISSGIVLPETYWSTQRLKRFRKAYFGITDSGTPALRLETDSGSQTYTISDSKANITRNLYGRTWTLKLQNFADVSFIELWPVILTR